MTNARPAQMDLIRPLEPSRFLGIYFASTQKPMSLNQVVRRVSKYLARDQVVSAVEASHAQDAFESEGLLSLWGDVLEKLGRAWVETSTSPSKPTGSERSRFSP